MSSTSSATIRTTVVGEYTYTLPTSTYSYSPNPNTKFMMDPDYKPPGYQRSIIILITFSCLVLLGTIISSALYWFRYRARWRMEEKEAFEIVYPNGKAKARNSRGLESDGEGDGETGGVVKSRWLVRRPESAVVMEGVKGAKRVVFSGHWVSNISINDNNRLQSQQLPQQMQQRQVYGTVEKEDDDDVVKIEIAPGQSNALEAERWMEEDRQRYQELSELIKSPAFVQKHQALLLQQPFQLQSPVGQSSPSCSQFLHSQSLQSQQQILLQLQEDILQQHQNLQEQQQQEQHQRQQEQQQKEQQGTPTRKLRQFPLGLYDQLSRKNSRAALSRASSKWTGGMDSLSPTLPTSSPPWPSLLSLSTAPSAVSTMPISVGDGVSLRTSQPPPGLSRLPTVHTPSYPPPPCATPTTTPARPFRIKISGAHYCLTPVLTTPSPSLSSAPWSSSSSVVDSSSFQSSLRSIPINMDSPTQPWKNVSAFAFPTPLSTTSLSISDGDGIQTPQTVSPIESGPIRHGVSKRTVQACVVLPQTEDEEEEEDGGKKGKERKERELFMSPTLPLSSTQFRRFYDL